MKKRVLIHIALQNFWSRRMRAILTIMAVTIGISAIIFLISLGYGLERLVTSQVANFEAFTIIDVPSANLKVQKINDSALAVISQVPHVVSVAPTTNLGGRIKLTDTESTTESVIQSSNLDYVKLSGYNLTEGKWFAEDDHEIVINRVLANLLFTQGTDSQNIIGKTVQLSLIVERDLRAPDSNEGSLVKDMDSLTISGIMEEGSNPIGFISQRQATLAGVVNFSSLKLKSDSKDPNTIKAIRKSLENLGYSTEYVGDTVDQIVQIFAYFRILLGAFGLIALIVASLGTFNTLTISLLERIREIGLLKALGMRSKDIYRLFITESMFIGLAGGLLGVFLGYGLGLSINLILQLLAKQAIVDPVSIFYTPWTLAFYVAIFSVIVGFITGLYPARRAVKTDALDAIRYE